MSRDNAPARHFANVLAKVANRLTAPWRIGAALAAALLLAWAAVMLRSSLVGKMRVWAPPHLCQPSWKIIGLQSGRQVPDNLSSGCVERLNDFEEFDHVKTALVSSPV